MSVGRPPLEPGGHGDPWVVPAPGGGFVSTLYVRDDDGQRRRISRKRPTAKAAKAAALEAAKARPASRSGSVGLSSATRFSDAAKVWLADREEHGAAASSLDQYRDRLSVILPTIGALRLGEMTPGRLRKAFDRLAEGRSVSTLRAYRAVVSGVLRLAVSLDAIPTNPAAGVLTDWRGSPKMPRALERPERAQLMVALRGDPKAPTYIPFLVRFMMTTGLRIGEALAMRWCDLDLDSARAEVNGTLVRIRGRGLHVSKGKTAAAHRVIPLPPSLVADLRVLPEAGVYADTARPLFAGTGGTWRSPQTVQAHLRAALDRAGFAWVTSHVFRKTAATILDEEGVSVRQVADHLGHANPSLTQDRYFGRQHDASQAAAALERAWGEGDQR